jgi:hypothetical protein
MTTNFFSPLSFVAVFGSGIPDPGSGMGKNQDPQHCLFVALYFIKLKNFNFFSNRYLPGKKKSRKRFESIDKEF